VNRRSFIVISGLGSCLSTQTLDNAHNSINSLDWVGHERKTDFREPLADNYVLKKEL